MVVYRTRGARTVTVYPKRLARMRHYISANPVTYNMSAALASTA